MNLLLVEDEEFTRQGILTLIPWSELEIDKVYVASNGAEGLIKAKEFQPDIILTDVRMPKLNGTDMAIQIKGFLPECEIIFISGYSDKDYLKTAIKLSALSYVEKPLDLEELENTLRQAVSVAKGRKENKRLQEEEQRKLTKVIPVLKNEVVSRLIHPNGTKGDTAEYINIAYPGLPKECPYIAILIELYGMAEQTVVVNGNMTSILCNMIENRIKLDGYKGIVGTRNDNLVIIYLCLENDMNNTEQEQNVMEFCHRLKEIMETTWKFAIAVGDICAGLTEIRFSYQSAAIVLQRAFYYGSGVVLFARDIIKTAEFYLREQDLFRMKMFMESGDRDGFRGVMEDVEKQVLACPGTLPSVVKDQLLSVVQMLLAAGKREGKINEQDKDSPRETFNSFSFFSQIRKYIEDIVVWYFSDIDQGYSESEYVRRIRRYIAAHYSESTLSLNQIANYMNMSVSSVCIHYKAECNQTVMQTITEYRIKKSQEMLCNPEMKVRDVAQFVGYSDSNYFIKVFKKAVGFPPQEYREKRFKYE